MTLSEVGRADQRVDLLSGYDVDADRRLLSVAEIQQAFRELTARKVAADQRPSGGRRTGATSRRSAAAPRLHTARPNDSLVGDQDACAAGYTSRQSAPNPRAKPRTLTFGLTDVDDAEDFAAPLPSGSDKCTSDLDASWIAVISAHAGAGASIIALSLADSYAASRTPTTLIETAHPSRSGLVAAATAELGTDASGAWRRGIRNHPGGGDIEVARRGDDLPPNGWPEIPETATVIADLGLPTPEALGRLARNGACVVVVFRPTMPGIRHTEHLLAALPHSVIALAAVGSRKWPREVTASLGPRLRDLRTARRIVTVPVDRRLEVTGPTSAPLPKAVRSAGHALVQLLDVPTPSGTEPPQFAPRRKGTRK